MSISAQTHLPKVWHQRWQREGTLVVHYKHAFIRVKQYLPWPTLIPQSRPSQGKFLGPICGTKYKVWNKTCKDEWEGWFLLFASWFICKCPAWCEDSEEGASIPPERRALPDLGVLSSLPSTNNQHTKLSVLFWNTWLMVYPAFQQVRWDAHTDRDPDRTWGYLMSLLPAERPAFRWLV